MSPAKKKAGNKVLKEPTAQGERKGLKAKTAAAPKDGDSKMVPGPLPRKTEVPKGWHVHQGLIIQRHSYEGRSQGLEAGWKDTKTEFLFPPKPSLYYFTVTYLSIRNFPLKKKK